MKTFSISDIGRRLALGLLVASAFATLPVLAQDAAPASTEEIAAPAEAAPAAEAAVAEAPVAEAVAEPVAEPAAPPNPPQRRLRPRRR